MPSFRVTGESVSLSQYDVLGEDGKELCFISHAGLAESDGLQTVGDARCLDMGPPLHGRDNPGSIQVDALGHAKLTNDEVNKIRTFVDLHAGEHATLRELSQTDVLRHAPKMYCIFPHRSPYEEDDGRYARTRFSCAGFVFEAYKAARIILVDMSSVPKIGIELVRSAYPVQVRLFENERISAEDLGLIGANEWPILLCGYLLHSMRRSADEIRESSYVVTVGDQYFLREAERQAESSRPT